MTIDVRDRAAVEKKLWDEIEDSRFGMLGAGSGAKGDFHPMTCFAEPESHSLWFYGRAESAAAVAARNGAPATLIVISKDQELQACITGQLTATQDTLHRDKFWNAMVSAWFPGGKDDPHLTMLRLECRGAEVWISDKGALKFGWEIAKANLTGAAPDVGGHVSLTFA